MAKSTILFDEHGNMNITEEGFTGNACADRTAKLLQGLGAKTASETKKPEFYNKVQDRGRQTIGR